MSGLDWLLIAFVIVWFFGTVADNRRIDDLKKRVDALERKP